MHRVIITEVNNEHHCELSKEFYNVAARSTRRIPKYDLKKMEGIMGLLKNNPNLSPLSLRPLLSECVPTYFIVDLQFIQNFRARVALYHSTHTDGNLDEISLKEANDLISKEKLSGKEHDVLNDPMVHTNFLAILRKVMQDDSGTQKAIGYLNELKIKVPGTDFRIRYNECHLPDAIVWMTPFMKNNLVRYTQEVR